MVFLFGMDVPLTEVMVGLAVMLFLCTIAVIVVVIKELQMNKKLDLLLKEEHKIKR